MDAPSFSMPWSKVTDHDECDGIAVVKDSTGEVEGCHDTEEAANEQLAALNASEDKTHMSGTKADAAQEQIVKAVGPDEAFAVQSTSANGEEGYFYPVYISRRAAQRESFSGETHEHEFEGFAMTLYMPDEPQVHGGEEAPDLPIMPSQSAMKAVKADASDLSQGDLVQWDSAGGMAQGRVEKVGMGDTLDPSTTDRTFDTSEEEPGVLIELVDKNEEGEVVGRGETVFHRPGTLSTISESDVPQKSIFEDALAARGGEAKAVGDGKVGGYLVRFTEEPDLEGDYFTKTTDFGTHSTTEVRYHHGQDRALGRRVLDDSAELKTDEVGVWVEAQLDMRDEYEEAIYQMAKQGKLGWSSGTASHLVDRKRTEKGHHIKSWPLGIDASLTPEPAEPRNVARPVKSFGSTNLEDTVDSLSQQQQNQMPETQEDPETKSAEEGAELSPLEEYKQGLITKNEYRKAKGLDPLDGGDVTADEPAQKAGGGRTVTTQNQQAPNYNAKTGTGDTPGKAFKHWVQHGDSSGLPMSMKAGEARPGDVQDAKLHGQTQIKVSPKTDEAFKSAMKADQDMLAGTDAQGGNAVPEGHFNGIIARRDEMMLANEVGVRDIPGQGTTVDVPVDDNTGEDFVQTNEAAQNDRDTPTLSNVSMTLNKFTKRVPLTNELMNDEASSLMSFIEDYVGRGQAKTHNDLLVSEVATNGTAFTTFAGTSSIAFGEPEDILSDEQLGFYLEDDSGSVCWVTRNSTLWEIKTLTGSDRQYDRGLFNDGDGRSLLGYPVKLSNKVDTLGTTNKPLLFGNFNFVAKREDPSFTVLRDPYSRAEEGIVQLHYYFRTVYKVLQSEAVGYGQNA